MHFPLLAGMNARLCIFKFRRNSRRVDWRAGRGLGLCSTMDGWYRPLFVHLSPYRPRPSQPHGNPEHDHRSPPPSRALHLHTDRPVARWSSCSTAARLGPQLCDTKKSVPSLPSSSPVQSRGLCSASKADTTQSIRGHFRLTKSELLSE